MAGEFVSGPTGSGGRGQAWRIALVVVCVAIGLPAHAYIDPGSGYLLFQAIAALIAGIAASVGFYWRKLTGFFKRMAGGKESAGSSGSNESAGEQNSGN